ncbi:MAG: sortase [Anaerolineales bacterium]
MKSIRVHFFYAFLLAALLASTFGTDVAFTSGNAVLTVTNGMAASLVLGQPNFTSAGAGITATTMSAPYDVAVDPTTGKVFVSERTNNRVLRFASMASLTNGSAAEAVLGQPNFTSSAAATTQNGMSQPFGLDVDSAGRLWVADFANNRVLRFDNASSKTTGANADGVLGQPNFTSSGSAANQSGMFFPSEVQIDSAGRLWVAEYGNSRVLRFDNAASKANGANADGVLGQPNFTSTAAACDQDSFSNPWGMFVDSAGRLWLPDQCRRVLRFDNAASKANGALADGILGQPNFTSSAGATTQNGMSFPTGVTGDNSSGRIFVTDRGNNRILVFDNAASLANGANASFVIGQANFTSNAPTPSSTGLGFPQKVYFDPANKVLWIADEGNNRALMYGAPDTTAPTALSQTLLASYSGTGPSSFTVTFSEDVSNSGGGTLIDDVTNPNNYKIINKGANGTVDTASCASAIGGDDTLITPSGGVIYAPNTAIVNIGSALPAGNYRLFVCGTTSIVDLAGNPLAGDGVTSGTDFTFDFTVGAAAAAISGNTSTNTSASSLPKTGFAPNKITTLPAQPADSAYAALGDLWLEIPSLNVKSSIVGVPQNADKTWDVSWLGNDTGWLNGTAFPTWNGNSLLTAHVTNASGVDGPFAALKSLKYGDQVIVHMGGVKYIYEVRETKLSRPYSTNYAFESKQDASYLTLVTCSGYNPLNESYLFRRVVRAVLVSTVSK